MKKKIFLQNTAMPVGGVEISLINFVKHMKDACDIDVHLFDVGGPLQGRLEETGIRILSSNGCLENVRNRVQNVDKEIAYVDDVISKAPMLPGEYDAAFSFKNTYEDNELVLRRVNAKRKFCISHGDPDFGTPLTSPRKKSMPEFDKVFFVSRALRDKAQLVLPNLENLDVLWNFQDSQGIIDKSNQETISYEQGRVNFVSPIRLDPVSKAPLRTAEVIKQLVQSGTADNFTWTILGDGPDREKLEQFIRENQLERFIHLEGEKKNPYPWIKNADFVFLGSIHEAFGMVMAEGSILGVPGVMTQTAGSTEFGKINGIMVCDNSEQGIYNALKEVIINRKRLAQMRESLRGYVYPNAEIKQKVLSSISPEQYHHTSEYGIGQV